VYGAAPQPSGYWTGGRGDGGTGERGAPASGGTRLLAGVLTLGGAVVAGALTPSLRHR